MCSGMVRTSLLTSFAERFDTHAEIKIDSSVLLFTVIVSVCTGLAFGLLPALSLGLNRKKDLAETLKQAEGRSTSGGKNRIRGLLVAAQVAISFTLPTAAGLLIKVLSNFRMSTPASTPRTIGDASRAELVQVQQCGDGERAIRLVLPADVGTNESGPGVVEASVASTYPLNPAGITQGPNNIAINWKVAREMTRNRQRKSIHVP